MDKGQQADSNYKWSVKISIFIAAIYLKELLIRKRCVASLCVWVSVFKIRPVKSFGNGIPSPKRGEGGRGANSYFYTLALPREFEDEICRNECIEY